MAKLIDVMQERRNDIRDQIVPKLRGHFNKTNIKVLVWVMDEEEKDPHYHVLVKGLKAEDQAIVESIARDVVKSEYFNATPTVEILVPAAARLDV